MQATHLRVTALLVVVVFVLGATQSHFPSLGKHGLTVKHQQSHATHDFFCRLVLSPFLENRSIAVSSHFVRIQND